MSKRKDDELEMVEADEQATPLDDIVAEVEQMPDPEPAEAPKPAPPIVWFAGVPQNVPDDPEARQREHEWQLEHNPGYQGQFAPKE